ncbi:hypothetical protein U6B65_04615 [Oscillospiraceae bacterium MB08-C2-2]|nr:hypothetical protein U6B65_04615 [Oscillospiraceae bacterium MB08-C2-2]
MQKEIKIQGCVEITEILLFDDFYDKFITFIEVRPWNERNR